MKCVNCRCIIPETSDYCIYCGYEVYKGGTITTPVIDRTALPYLRNPYAGQYTERNSAELRRIDSACVNPAYYGYFEEQNRWDNTQNGYTNAEYGSDSQMWDFSVVNEDGTLNLPKLLLYFACVDILLILLLLLIALASML